MSPAMTLKSCGSSSSESLRMMRPIRVMRASSLGGLGDLRAVLQHMHGAEFQDAEGPAVQSGAALAEQQRSARIQHDGQRHQRQHGAATAASGQGTKRRPARAWRQGCLAGAARPKPSRAGKTAFITAWDVSCLLTPKASVQGEPLQEMGQRKARFLPILVRKERFAASKRDRRGQLTLGRSHFGLEQGTGARRGPDCAGATTLPKNNFQISGLRENAP